MFTAPYGGPGPSGPEIFNESGELVWFDPLAGEAAATNLQVQQYDGKPVLTWWQGYIPPQGFGQGEEMIYSAPTSRSDACMRATATRPTCTTSTSPRRARRC